MNIKTNERCKQRAFILHTSQPCSCSYNNEPVITMVHVPYDAEMHVISASSHPARDYTKSARPLPAQHLYNASRRNCSSTTAPTVPRDAINLDSFSGPPEDFLQDTVAKLHRLQKVKSSLCTMP